MDAFHSRNRQPARFPGRKCDGPGRRHGHRHSFCFGQVALGQAVRISADAWPGVEFDGTVTALEPLVDPRTRSFQVEVSLPNPDLMLRPGMFLDTRLLLPARKNVLTLPQVAISYNPCGDSVFVVEDAEDENGGAVLVAKSVFVTLGETRGDQVAISTGLEAGQRAVSAGQLRLHKGSRVIIDDRFEVANNPDPSADNNWSACPSQIRLCTNPFSRRCSIYSLSCWASWPTGN